ncbi:MAG: AAA family ATPase [Vulcanococcus sp.]|jgi:MoxR-like ATPase
MASAPLTALLEALNGVLLGKEEQVKLAVTCLLAGGHLLIEDLPGMGKTTLAEALARVFGLAFKRVSFTSDLLPADLTGLNVFDPASASFHFQSGPLFSQVLLADEINRASPRTQSALLEAMATGRVSVDGVTHALPQPFVVIATQNGLDQIGTAALPESQLDRFLMRLSLGFPSREAEAAMLAGQRASLDQLAERLSATTLIALQAQVRRQHCERALIDYVLDLLQASRRGGERHGPLSPRAGLALLQAARAWALIAGRAYVTPADVQAVFPAVAEHRLDGGQVTATARPFSQGLLEQVDAIR